MIKVHAEAVMSGPLLDGRGSQIIDQSLQDIVEKVAQEGVNRVHARLGQVLKHPTGYYESRVVTDRSVSDVSVTDSGVVYGPWLEGVSSRNTRSRFKGYHTFRLVAQDLQRDALRVADPEVKQMMTRLGGK